MDQRKKASGAAIIVPLTPTTLDVASIANDAGGGSTAVLSNGARTVTQNGTGGRGSVRALAAAQKSALKFYFEATVNISGDAAVGVVQSGLATSVQPAVDGGVAGMVQLNQFNGNVYNNSASSTPTFPGNSWSAGSTVGVAVDLDNKRIWFIGTSAGMANWNNSGSASPAANVGGINISGLTFPLLPWVEVYTGGQTITVNFGQSAFLIGQPAGFNNWGT